MMSVVDKLDFLKHIWQKTLSDIYLFLFCFVYQDYCEGPCIFT